jgi:hypothetical protein
MKGRLTRLAYALATGTREPALGLAADRRRSEWPWRHRLRDTPAQG